MKNIKRILVVICSLLFLTVVSLPIFFTWKRINRKDFYDYNDNTTWISNSPFIELVVNDGEKKNAPTIITGIMYINDVKVDIYASTLNSAEKIFIFSREKNLVDGFLCGDPIFEGTYEFKNEDFVLNISKDYDDIFSDELESIYFKKIE